MSNVHGLSPSNVQCLHQCFKGVIWTNAINSHRLAYRKLEQLLFGNGVLIWTKTGSGTLQCTGVYVIDDTGLEQKYECWTM